MLTIMTVSGIWGLKQSKHGSSANITKQEAQTVRAPTIGILTTDIVRTMAVIQLFLAAAALTSYHVQIITRISSAYPVWYWFLASCMNEKSSTRGVESQRHVRFVIQYLVIYAVIQGGLFASFLPPA